ncbi:MAG: hypothetical protein JJT76_12530 [Clostridiaceae bacterium]|nr:hypothetical protein [Clostridiaceae bacterium]
MIKRREIKVVVNKPNQEELENLVAESVTKITMLRIDRLPEYQRVHTLEQVLRRLKERGKLE